MLGDDRQRTDPAYEGNPLLFWRSSSSAAKAVHIVWITKYRYKVLEGALRGRIRTIIRQVCKELGVEIVSGVLSREHVHMFVEIPPHIAVSDFVRRVRTTRQVVDRRLAGRRGSGKHKQMRIPAGP